MRAPPVRNRWRAALAAVGGLIACSTVPPPVVSPVPRAPFGQALTWSVDWGYARAHVQRPDGSVEVVSANGDSSWGDSDREATVLALPIPAMASLHQAVPDGDIGEYAGWRRFGATARFRLEATAGGAVTSIASALNVQWTLRGVDGSLALEQSLPLAPYFVLLGRIGVSYGLRDYDVEVPADVVSTEYVDHTIGTAHFDIQRSDLRIEPLIGVILGAESYVILSFQPYFVVARGAFTSDGCAACLPGTRLLDFAQNLGIAVALTLHEP